MIVPPTGPSTPEADSHYSADTLYSAFTAVALRYGEHAALRYREDGTWHHITYNGLRRKIDCVAAALARRGVTPGDRVGIFSCPCPEWIMAELAAAKLGAVIVAIPPDLAIARVTAIIERHRIGTLFVRNRAALAKLPRLAVRTVLLEHDGQSGCIDFKELLAGSARAAHIPEWRVSACDPARIVCHPEPDYTALTHGAILSHVRSFNAAHGLSPKDTTLSYPPPFRLLERTLGHYALLLAGGCIGFAEDPAGIAPLLARFRPTIMWAMPRELERACVSAADTLRHNRPSWRRLVVAAALVCLRETSPHRIHPPFRRLKRGLFDLVVFRRLRDLVGGRMRLLVTGETPGPRLTDTLHLLGIDITTGHALTPASPPVTCKHSPAPDTPCTLDPLPLRSDGIISRSYAF
jgi:long-chain acyl-CoA synthetase